MSRYARLIKNGLLLLCLLPVVSIAVAQSAESPFDGNNADRPVLSEQVELYTQVKYFDFDERKLGNYEETPLHWVQQRGDGLPILFARGRIDEETGRAAAPSFRLDIATGNVAYEYQHLDLTVVPESDYSLTGYIRADGLKYAGALVTAHFVDRFGEPITGSHHVSRIVRATGKDPEPWQRVTIDLPGEFPLAYALRLQFWILQDYVWRESDPEEISPIVRRDVYATAWFDDFSVYRLPRVNLRLSSSSGLVEPGRREEVVLDVNNATSQPLRMVLTITDATGRSHLSKQLEVPPMISLADLVTDSNPTTQPESTRDLARAAFERRHIAAIREPLPDLAPGFYSAELLVLGGTETLLKRRMNFSVLPPLPAGDLRYLDLGVDLGRWRRSNIAGVTQLLTGLGCGAIKIGIPMAGKIEGEEKTAYFHQLSTLIRVLAENRIDTTGVILAPPPTHMTQTDKTTRGLVSRGDAWRDLFSPILAHFGALLPTWQLGNEAIELEKAQLWEPANIERVRNHLRRFVSIPKIAIPRPITAIPPANDDIVSIWVPPEVPTRGLPHLLDFLIGDNSSSYWLQLATDTRSGLSNARRIDDLVRRLVLAKALNPGRIFLPAPFELSKRGGQPTWQPTEDYLVYRTMFHYLSGKSAAGAMKPNPNTLVIIFQGPDSSCLIIWSWQEKPLDQTVDLYIGPHPRAINIWGESWPLEVKDGRTRIPVGPTPLIVESLHTPLALLQASYRVAPTYVQMHTPEPRPVITFRNTYGMSLVGEVRLAPPGNWLVKPMQRSFKLAPGETFAMPLTLMLPPRQIAQTHELGVHLTLHTPEAGELHFLESLTVGLSDIDLESLAYWDGNDLIIKQSLRNLSDGIVSFNTYCDPPGRAREERFFNDIAPGEVSIQTYVIPNGRDLAGMRIPMGIVEIDGPRSLNQFAEVPQ